MKCKNIIKKVMSWVLLVVALSSCIFLFREYIPTPIHILTLLFIAIALALFINVKRLTDSRNVLSSPPDSRSFRGHLEYKNIKKHVYKTEMIRDEDGI